MVVNMRKVILWFRYLVLGVFIICNATICSVAVWNFSIGQSTGLNLHVDIFLTAIGALSLLFVFPIGFVELLRVDSVTCHVWFECLWVGVFAILEFSGAVALSVIAPSLMCSPTIVALLGNSCSSTHILMAFSWTCSVCLLGYSFLLLFTTMAFAGRHPQIWHYKVHRFPIHAPSCSQSACIENKPAIVAPKPRRAVPAALYAYRSGLGSQYQIEHFRPPTPAGESPKSPAPDATPTPWRTAQNTRVDDGSRSAIAFYPQHMQSILTTPSLTPPQTSEFSPSPPPPALVERLRAATLPLRIERTHPEKTRTLTSPPPTRPKPTGPRSRTNSRDWRRLASPDLGQAV